MDTIPTIPGYHINRWGDLQKVKEKQLRYIRFVCPDCDCEFEADKNHYKIFSDQREGTNWYETECPCCGHKVSRDR